jgi:hypothetical protein
MIRFVLLSFSVILLSSPLAAQAKMYKWVDENGQMHFGDKIPSKYVVKEHEELNEQGVTIKHKEAAKTREQKAEEKRLEKERKMAELEEKKKKQRDRVLLDTYTTERDLIVARDSRLDAVGSQIHLAESIIADSNNKIESMEKQVTQIKASNREVPADLYQRIEGEKRQVEVQSEVMENHIKRRDEIATQFNGYIERFKVLKAEQKAKRDKLIKERSGTL